MQVIMEELLAAFIPSYPEVYMEDFPKQLAQKKEFNELYLETSEPVPEEAGQLLQTQQFMKRFFSTETPYNKGILFHGLGSGKTCTASAIVESWKNVDVGGKKRRPSVVIAKNDELVRNIIQEVSKRCTKDTYMVKLTPLEESKGIHLTSDARKIRLKKAVSKSYSIHPAETFLRRIHKLTDEQIKAEYSYRVIIIDEGHTFRPQAKVKKEKEVVVLYDQLHRFTHLVEGCMILVLTGTPIWDKPSEIASLVNLINNENEQLPLGSEFDKQFFDDKGILKPSIIQLLKDRLQGKISFLRQMTTTATKIEEGTSEPWLNHLKVFPDAMSEFQAKYARNAREEKETKTVMIKGKVKERVTEGGTVYKLARDSMNMVLPIMDSEGKEIGVYGTEAFKEHIVRSETKTRRKKQVTVTTYSISNPFTRNALRDNLAKYSIKFASIIKDLTDNPNQVAFIYNEEVTGVGGCIMLGLCLQLHGFVWAKTAHDISKTPSNKATRRFAVITSDPQTTYQPNQIQELLVSANKEDNCYGSRLQIIIGSEKIALGISIKNVRRIHTVMPHWNLSSTDQAENRGFRVGSHSALKPEEREIHIFRHVAVERSRGTAKAFAAGVGYPSDAAFTKYDTIDIYISRIAEDKDYKNAQIYRVLKEVAFDCGVFYKRNVLENDIPNTRECNYTECNYQCDGFPISRDAKKKKVWDYTIPEDELDYSTYNLFYATDAIRDIIDKFIELFKSEFSIVTDTAKQRLGISDETSFIFHQAIDLMINNRILIRNRYGIGCYLKEAGNILFLDNNITSSANYAESIYIQHPLVSERTTLEALIDRLEIGKDKELVEQFCVKPYDALFNSMAYKTRILLLEVVYPLIVSKKATPAQQKVIDIIMKNLGSGLYVMKDGSVVHILHSDEFKGQAYDVAAKDIRVTGTMRVYIPKTKDWGYVDEAKEEEYITEIKSKASQEKEDIFKDNPYGIFGWVSKKDGKFRINIKPESGKTVRGRMCSTFKSTELLNVMKKIGFPLYQTVKGKKKIFPPPNQEYAKTDRESLITKIMGRPVPSNFKAEVKENPDQYDDTQLRSILTLKTSRIDQLCDILQLWLETESPKIEKKGGPKLFEIK